MYHTFKIELVRLISFLFAYLIYLSRRQRIKTKIISISETAVSHWSHVSFEVMLEAPGLEFKINVLKIVPNCDIGTEGLISWSIIAAREVMRQKNFPSNPTFVRVFGKTYSLTKTPKVS